MILHLMVCILILSFTFSFIIKEIQLFLSTLVTETSPNGQDLGFLDIFVIVLFQSNFDIWIKQL